MGNLADVEHWTSAYVAAIATAFGAFIAAAVTTPPTNLGTVTHINVSYFSGFTNKTFPSGRVHPVPNLRSGGPFKDTVQSYGVNAIIASQRRRNGQSV